jgi:hypothetical protein
LTDGGGSPCYGEIRFQQVFSAVVLPGDSAIRQIGGGFGSAI